MYFVSIINLFIYLLGDLLRTSTELERTREEIANHEQRAPAAAQRYRFYQELRGYVADLVECMDEKLPQVAQVERHAMDVLARASERLVERRRQDARDQAEEVSRGNTRARQANGPEDEARVRRAAEREGRRARRRRARELAPPPTRHIDGMSSDDEIPDQERLALEQQRQAVLAEAQEVLEDVTEDYATVGAMLARFERWRATDVIAYGEAYAGTVLAKVLKDVHFLFVLNTL